MVDYTTNIILGLQLVVTLFVAFLKYKSHSQKKIINVDVHETYSHTKEDR